MKPTILFNFLVFIVFLSGCGTIKLSDNTQYLSKPHLERKFWTVKSQGNPPVVLNSLESSRISGDSLILNGNNGKVVLPLVTILSLEQSELILNPKEKEELNDMKQEGGLLIGGVVGAAAGAAIAGEDFSGKGALYTISGAVAGSIAGYYTGERIVLSQEKPKLTAFRLSDKTIIERKEILYGLIEKKD